MTAESAGNIIFDNCYGQNKNNMVLKLALWIKAMGYFKSVILFCLLLYILKMLLTTFSRSSKNPLTMTLNLWTSHLVEHTVDVHNVGTGVQCSGRSLCAFGAAFEGGQVHGVPLQGC